MLNRHNKADGLALLLFVFIIYAPGINAAEGDVVLRPYAGYSRVSSSISSLDGNSSNIGFRLMFGAGEKKSAGLEVTRFDLGGGNDFYAAGIVIEQRIRQTISISIGTLGYFDMGVNSDNPVGLSASINWEPRAGKNFQPYLSLRNDVVFYSETVSIYSISAGFKLDL